MVQVDMSIVRRFVCAVSAAGLLAAVTPAFALDDGPAKPRIDCSKPANKNKPACKPHHVSDDAIINGAYWLAHTGKLKEALELLATVEDQENPRALNALGFSTRKLGNVDGAFPYYTRALEIEPNYVQARAYLGEAFLAKGDVAHAREQLGEIGRRAGAGSFAFAELQRQISAFETTHPANG